MYINKTYSLKGGGGGHNPSAKSRHMSASMILVGRHKLKLYAVCKFSACQGTILPPDSLSCDKMGFIELPLCPDLFSIMHQRDAISPPFASACMNMFIPT